MARRTGTGAPRARIVAGAIGAVLIIVAAAYIFATNHTAGEAGECRTAVTVRGVIGSEKEPFFDDKRVTDRLTCLGYTVEVDSRGSREMLDTLTRPDHGYAFAFPSSTPTAEKLMRTLHVDDRYPLFSTPMAVATFTPIVDVLRGAGVVQKTSNGAEVLDIAALLNLVRQGVTWDRLPGNNAYPARKTVLLSTTDPQDSNSAIMFLSIASQVANNGAIVTTAAQTQQVLPDLCRLIFDQGDKPETSQVLFDNYVVDGMGRTPMALIYEAQYKTKAEPPRFGGDHTLIFPRPTVYSRHTLIPLTPDGDAVGRALRDDPELVRLVTEHGFRPEKPVGDTVNGPRPVDVVESPSFDVLETMLSALAPTAENAARCAR